MGNAWISICFSSSVWSCLMHALSSHTRGSAMPPRRASSPHATSCANLAGPGSCQLWLTKPSTCPSFAGAVFSYRPESALLTRSSSCSSESARARKRLAPSASASDAEPPPTNEAIVAASDSFVLLLPSELIKRWNRPRLRGVAAAAISQHTGVTTSHQKGCANHVHGYISTPNGWSMSHAGPMPTYVRRKTRHRWRSAARGCIARFGQQKEQQSAGDIRKAALNRMVMRKMLVMLGSRRTFPVNIRRPKSMHSVKYTQHVMRMARVSTGRIARTMRGSPMNPTADHTLEGPTIQSRSTPVLSWTTTGVKPNTNTAKPSCSRLPDTRRRVFASARRAAASLCLVSPCDDSG